MIFLSPEQPQRDARVNKYDLQLRVVQIDFLLEIIAPLKNEGNAKVRTQRPKPVTQYGRVRCRETGSSRGAGFRSWVLASL